MSTDDKHRKPDHHVQLIKPGSNGKDRFYDIGDLWNGKEGYMSGDTPFGRIVIISRQKREELMRMRQEKQAAREHQPDIEKNVEISQ